MRDVKADFFMVPKRSLLVERDTLPLNVQHLFVHDLRLTNLHFMASQACAIITILNVLWAPLSRIYPEFHVP